MTLAAYLLLREAIGIDLDEANTQQYAQWSRNHVQPYLPDLTFTTLASPDGVRSFRGIDIPASAMAATTSMEPPPRTRTSRPPPFRTAEPAPMTLVITEHGGFRTIPDQGRRPCRIQPVTALASPADEDDLLRETAQAAFTDLVHQFGITAYLQPGRPSCQDSGTPGCTSPGAGTVAGDVPTDAFGWLGSKQRSSETPSGLSLMGAASTTPPPDASSPPAPAPAATPTSTARPVPSTATTWTVGSAARSARGRRPPSVWGSPLTTGSRETAAKPSSAV
ncbi:hypothetical protein ACIQGZ_25455 [Streptomyces sp. NPDC092296]|uniref:hypothetical protein n=1 Tax=Streptomyces sp. NPDC092296 TaxID=3366012 RepID=UPI00382D8423